MSRYLQRLAQRSGLAVGGAGRPEPTVGGVSSGTAAGRGAARGIEVIDEVVTVRQPQSSPRGRSTGDAAEFVDRSPGQVDSDAPAPHGDRAGREAAAAVGNEDASLAAHESIETTVPKSAVPAASQPRSPMGPVPAEDRVPIDPKGPAAFFDKASESRGPTPGPDVAETPGESAEPELAVGPIAPVTRPGSAEGPIEGLMEDPTESGQTPSGRVDRAIQWVMDDPHWVGQGAAVAPDEADGHGLDTLASVVEAASPRRGAGPSSIGDSAAGPIDGRDEAGSPANRDRAAPGIQLHIGRIAIEVHQAEPPGQLLQAPAAADRPGPARPAVGSSDSRLRRLYLRGF